MKLYEIAASERFEERFRCLVAGEPLLDEFPEHPISLLRLRCFEARKAFWDGVGLSLGWRPPMPKRTDLDFEELLLRSELASRSDWIAEMQEQRDRERRSSARVRSVAR